MGIQSKQINLTRLVKIDLHCKCYSSIACSSERESERANKTQELLLLDYLQGSPASFYLFQITVESFIPAWPVPTGSLSYHDWHSENKPTS